MRGAPSNLRPHRPPDIPLNSKRCNNTNKTYKDNQSKTSNSHRHHRPCELEVQTIQESTAVIYRENDASVPSNIPELVPKVLPANIHSDHSASDNDQVAGPQQEMRKTEIAPVAPPLHSRGSNCSSWVGHRPGHTKGASSSGIRGVDKSRAQGTLKLNLFTSPRPDLNKIITGTSQRAGAVAASINSSPRIKYDRAKNDVVVVNQNQKKEVYPAASQEPKPSLDKDADAHQLSGGFSLYADATFLDKEEFDRERITLAALEPVVNIFDGILQYSSLGTHTSNINNSNSNSNNSNNNCSLSADYHAVKLGEELNSDLGFCDNDMNSVSHVDVAGSPVFSIRNHLYEIICDPSVDESMISSNGDQKGFTEEDAIDAIRNPALNSNAVVYNMDGHRINANSDSNNRIISRNHLTSSRPGSRSNISNQKPPPRRWKSCGRLINVSSGIYFLKSGFELADAASPRDNIQDEGENRRNGSSNNINNSNTRIMYRGNDNHLRLCKSVVGVYGGIANGSEDPLGQSARVSDINYNHNADLREGL
jgi:hypothetical protein